MCRLLGVVSSETTDFRFGLHEGRRSLAALSDEHPDGWGVAVHRGGEGWEVHKHAVHARTCDRYAEIAERAAGELLIAHIRKRTVGPISERNTHPFRRGRWIFAHNGTIEDLSWFAARTSSLRAREIEGDTDSERLFAFILTRLDEIDHDPRRLDGAVVGVVEEALGHRGLGAANFLLSDGTTLFAFRFGRTLHVLERHPGDAVVERRISPETDAELDTTWSPRRHAVLVASEAMTDEPWRVVPEGALLRIERSPAPTLRVLRAR
jgi:glutamine amidotransferase